MSTQEEYNDRLLREYLNPKMNEKAPDGFTLNVMSRVRMEPKPVRHRHHYLSGYSVPLISLLVTAVLAVTALLLPAANTELPGNQWISIVRHLIIPATKINLDHLVDFNLPGYLPYLFVCLLFLAFFDRGLNLFFHRGK